MDNGNKIIFLGTNGWYDTDTGNTISILVDCRDYSIILDAGIGIYKLDKYIDFSKPAFLFLSHFHLDHLYGLHILNKFSFKKGLTIFGQEGTKGILDIIVNTPFSMPMDKLPYRTDVLEVPGETTALPFYSEVLPMEHTSPTLGLRIIVDDKIITYCPDTGLCSNALSLARNADILIAECAYRPGEIHNSWPHLNPESAASIAKESGAKNLFLVHFDASRYKDRESRVDAEKAAQKIFPAAIACFDGLTIGF